MKTRLVASFLLVASAGFTQSYLDLVKADPNNWFSYSGSYGAQRHSALKQINTGNVDSLIVKWIYHVPKAEELEGVPVVSNGVMYVTQSNEVDALDARSGRLIWQYQRSTRGAGHNRGVAVYERKVYVGTTDAFLIALDARTGSVIWETKMLSARYMGGAPLVVNNKVIVGLYSASGLVDAYDAETGKPLWRWTALPKPGEAGSETWAGGDARWRPDLAYRQL